MRISVTHGIDDLATDLAAIPVRAAADLVDVVRSNAYQGKRVAKDFARVSAGKHGKRYHEAFSVDMRSPLSWEYGPDAAKPQGGMSFEFGSRNQKPHLDLSRSADIQGPQFAKDVGDVIDELFW